MGLLLAENIALEWKPDWGRDSPRRAAHMEAFVKMAHNLTLGRIDIWIIDSNPVLICCETTEELVQRGCKTFYDRDRRLVEVKPDWTGQYRRRYVEEVEGEVEEEDASRNDHWS